MNWMEQVYAREPNAGADQEGLSMQGDDRRTPRAEAGRAVFLNPTSSAILSCQSWCLSLEIGSYLSQRARSSNGRLSSMRIKRNGFHPAPRV